MNKPWTTWRTVALIAGVICLAVGFGVAPRCTVEVKPTVTVTTTP